VTLPDAGCIEWLSPASFWAAGDRSFVWARDARDATGSYRTPTKVHADRRMAVRTPGCLGRRHGH
jgi:hypothetical protein